MKRCVDSIRRSSVLKSHLGKDTPTIWFPTMAALLPTSLEQAFTRSK